MKTKEFEKPKSIMSFSDRLAIFDTKLNHQVLYRKNAIVEFEKKETSFEKKMKLYQPKKQNDIKLNISGDIRKKEKRENKYILKNEKDKNNEINKNTKMNKTTISNIEYVKLPKNDIPLPNKNIEQKKPSTRKASDNMYAIPHKNNFSEIVKIFNQNEPLRTDNKRNNNKVIIKSKEKVNKINNHLNNKIIDNTKYINISISKNDINNNSAFYSNKNKNTNNINKDIKEISYRHSSKEKKVLDTVQLFSKNPKKKEQEKNPNKINIVINTENKKKININNNIKDRIAFFNNDLNKSFEKKGYKININLNKEEENKVSLKHNKDLKKNEIINPELHNTIKNNNNYEKQNNKKEIFEKKERYSYAKYLKFDFKDKNQENNEEKIIKTSPKKYYHLSLLKHLILLK